MKGCFLIVLLVVFGCSGTKQNGMFENPIIPGFNPDPSICRVGEDYYGKECNNHADFYWFEYQKHTE